MSRISSVLGFDLWQQIWCGEIVQRYEAHSVKVGAYGLTNQLNHHRFKNHIREELLGQLTTEGEEGGA